MFKTGQYQTLYVNRFSDYGAFLSDAINGEDEVLLPKKYLSNDLAVDSAIEVFVYRDSEQRLVATTEKPLLTVGQIGFLKLVGEISGGFFLDMGLEKDLFMPFNETKGKPKKGKKCLVFVYLDQKDQLCASMKIYNHLKNSEGFKVGDAVSGVVIEVKEPIGAFVAVEGLYHGLIPMHELYNEVKEGAQIKGRITKVREDGKVNISLREKTVVQINDDVKMLLEALDASDGVLYLNDDTDPAIIKKRLNMSKRAFKRAVGRLLKEGQITITEDGIERIK